MSEALYLVLRTYQSCLHQSTLSYFVHSKEESSLLICRGKGFSATQIYSRTWWGSTSIFEMATVDLSEENLGVTIVLPSFWMNGFSENYKLHEGKYRIPLALCRSFNAQHRRPSFADSINEWILYLTVLQLSAIKVGTKGTWCDFFLLWSTKAFVLVCSLTVTCLLVFLFHSSVPVMCQVLWGF